MCAKELIKVAENAAKSGKLPFDRTLRTKPLVIAVFAPSLSLGVA
jgi:hypothetical protein